MVFETRCCLLFQTKSKLSFSRCDKRLELTVETETSCKKWGRANDFTTVILPFSVRLLENQGFKILLIFFNFISYVKLSHFFMVQREPCTKGSEWIINPFNTK